MGRGGYSIKCVHARCVFAHRSTHFIYAGSSSSRQPRLATHIDLDMDGLLCTYKVVTITRNPSYRKMMRGIWFWSLAPSSSHCSPPRVVVNDFSFCRASFLHSSFLLYAYTKVNSSWCLRVSSIYADCVVASSWVGDILRAISSLYIVEACNRHVANGWMDGCLPSWYEEAEHTTIYTILNIHCSGMCCLGLLGQTTWKRRRCSAQPSSSPLYRFFWRPVWAKTRILRSVISWWMWSHHLDTNARRLFYIFIVVILVRDLYV